MTLGRTEAEKREGRIWFAVLVTIEVAAVIGWVIAVVVST